ncbi:hypothetical protein BDM02DRAFT_1973904 [Thelephora ganbajun]|uniref:Uncharacterized protein n=1 Tax=Thelephora ganbajun TaxID=370292 RepID=A0ACB6YZA0_THEGA|nr:hypothetical protein BDM02DRAFT_1973904 [Thelephora ganbajun]
MEMLVGDVVPAKFNIPSSAKALTQRMSDNIKAVRESGTTADRRMLRDDATAFTKTVILLCNTFKNQRTEGPLSTDLRANMILLMSATESVVLPHVSSFLPSTSGPYSPLVSTRGIREDMKNFRIGLGITVTRNA